PPPPAGAGRGVRVPALARGHLQQGGAGRVRPVGQGRPAGPARRPCPGPVVHEHGGRPAGRPPPAGGVRPGDALPVCPAAPRPAAVLTPHRLPIFADRATLPNRLTVTAG